jgi:hypothetical protein
VSQSTVPAIDLPSLLAELQALPGQVSFKLAQLDGNPTKGAPHRPPRVLAELNPAVSLAIASSFKLYVLGALVADLIAGKRTWSDTVTLQERWKSLPSGFLHLWPGGSPLTLHTLATLMTSQSDNTATDHLILTLGREHVEKTQVAMGMAAPERNVPVLTTRELFLLTLGSDPQALESYVAKDELARRAYLAAGAITQQKLADVRPLPDTPLAIDKGEWFGSAADLVTALDWFKANTEGGEASRARRVLALNPGPVAIDKQAWPFIGYKGGWNVGVTACAYLLRSSRGAWYAVGAVWNNPEAGLEDARFHALIARAIELIA